MYTNSVSSHNKHTPSPLRGSTAFSCLDK